MAASSVSTSAPVPVVLICGDDEFSVKQRARKLYDQWCGELGGMDHEIVEATCSNAGQALEALRKLWAALNTLPFFGGAKVVWLKDCNFLGDERTATSAAVTEALGELAADLKSFRWTGVRLLISSSKADKRRVLVKWLEASGTVEMFQALSADDKDWATKAESEVLRALKAVQREIRDDALGELVSRVGPNLRSLANEVEKLILYIGERTEIRTEDVQSITSRQKLAQAFALSEALGERDLPRLMRTLDQELWEIRVGMDKSKSEIGLLYGLISKVRVLLILREMRDRGWLRPGADYNAFRAQMMEIPAARLPSDRRFNPLSGHPYVVYQSFRQSENYRAIELTRAMEILLEANLKLVGSSLDEGVALQQALVEIVGFSGRASKQTRRSSS